LVLILPAGHKIQYVLPVFGMEKFKKHVLHWDNPCIGAYVPIEQSLHVVWFIKSVYLPSGHTLQIVAALILFQYPTEHGEHSVFSGDLL
jgi:hypothetical protein